MTKADIIARIAQDTGIEKSVATTVVEAFMESVRESMIAGNEVFLRGFGSFIIKQRAEKKARNISKNTTIVICSCVQACKDILRCGKRGKIKKV